MTSSPAPASSQEQYFAVSLLFIDRAVTFAADLGIDNVTIADQVAAFKLHEHHLHQINNQFKGIMIFKLIEREKRKSSNWLCW